LKKGEEVFTKKAKDAMTEVQEKEERMLKTIGQQRMEIDFLKKAPSWVSPKSGERNWWTGNPS